MVIYVILEVFTDRREVMIMNVVLFYYLPPIAALVLFSICVSIVKKIVNKEETTKHTITGAILFSYLFYTLMYIGYS